MNIIIIVSILVRFTALLLSLLLLKRLRDWRMGFLSIMLGLMTIRQTLTLKISKAETSIDPALGHFSISEIPGLIVSLMALIFVFFLNDILSNLKRSNNDLSSLRRTPFNGHTILS